MIDGLICVNKETGMSSHGVVARVRSLTGQKKVGHSGTLDPMAGGVLVICLGKGTKVSQYIMDAGKTYRATMLLGTVTDSQDTTGNIISRFAPAFSDEEAADMIKRSAADFTGQILQTPPMHSALKKNGVKLYTLARQGIEVERAPREIKIYGIEYLKRAGELEHELRIACSKGTYVRTLIHDIGSRLGCGACMSGLVRESVGPFKIENAYTLGELEDLLNERKLEEALLPIDGALSQFEPLAADYEQEALIKNGVRLEWDAFGAHSGKTYRVYSGDGRLLMLAKAEEDGLLHMLTSFY